MEKMIKKIDEICSECASAKMVVKLGERLFDRTIICTECRQIAECPKYGSRNIGYFKAGGDVEIVLTDLISIHEEKNKINIYKMR